MVLQTNTRKDKGKDAGAMSKGIGQNMDECVRNEVQ